ncbi:MAG: hypothetical protein QF440_05195 [Candidatus Thalassarchaeaceae archaeon]|nr:hypothetical protein [Candidatus Thalassarchaeaceae archaeon]
MADGSPESNLANADLRDQLKSMEAKLSRLRDIRQQHNDAGKRNADKRNSVQKEYNKLRDDIKTLLAENKVIRAKAKTHQARRDAIQEQIRELIGRARDSRGQKGKKSPIIELSELNSQIEKLERMLETTPMKIEKENKVVKLVKQHMNRRKELEPLVEEAMRIKIDLGNIEGSIKDLKAEADAEHAAMVATNKEGDELWSTIEPRFEERDFKKAEGDRHHEAFVECRKKADEAHQDVLSMLAQVNEIRDKLKQERLEAQSWIDEHNDSVRKELTTPDQDEDLAKSLTEALLAGSNVSIGGTERGTNANIRTQRENKTPQRRRGASRGNRGRSKPKSE